MSEDVQRPMDEFRMAIAGPLVTFILGGIFGFLYLLLRSKNISPVIVAPLGYLATTNLAIGGFNLLPGFPLDGGRVFRSLCLLYTSDAADDLLCVDLGGRRIIK